MSIDIGQVFSSCWSMIKQRFFLLLGLWVVFFALNFLYSLVFGGLVGGSLFAAMGLAGLGGGLDDASMLGGLGIGALLMFALFYAGYIVIMFAQYCAMALMASPLEKPQFGDAVIEGFKGGLTFLGVMLIFIIAYIVLLLLGMLVGLLMSFLGAIGGIIFGIAFFALAVFVAVRLSVIVPVVVVDKVYNPITALNTTWKMTAGKALPILAIYAIYVLALIVIVGLPAYLLIDGFGDGLADGSASSMGAIAGLIGMVALFFPLMILVSIVGSALVSSLHAQITDTPLEQLEETFS